MVTGTVEVHRQLRSRAKAGAVACPALVEWCPASRSIATGLGHDRRRVLPRCRPSRPGRRRDGVDRRVWWWRRRFEHGHCGAVVGVAPPGAQSPTVAPTIQAVAEFLGSVRASIPDYTDHAGFINFASPEGDVGCTITEGTDQRVTCKVKDFTYTVRESGACPDSGTWGATAALTSTAAWACTTDRVGGDRVLGYGARVETGDFSCVSRPDGITCRNATTDHGFRVAKAFYTFF